MYPFVTQKVLGYGLSFYSTSSLNNIDESRDEISKKSN